VVEVVAERGGEAREHVRVGQPVEHAGDAEHLVRYVKNLRCNIGNCCILELRDTDVKEAFAASLSLCEFVYPRSGAHRESVVEVVKWVVVVLVAHRPSEVDERFVRDAEALGEPEVSATMLSKRPTDMHFPLSRR
jgi:hypothetical protein